MKYVVSGFDKKHKKPYCFLRSFATQHVKRLATGALVFVLMVLVLSQKTLAYECREDAQQTLLGDEARVGLGASLPSSSEKRSRVTAFTWLGNGAFILCLDDKKTVIAYGRGEQDEMPAMEEVVAPSFPGQLDRLASLGFNDVDILKALVDKFNRIARDHSREEVGMFLIQEIRNMLTTVALPEENGGAYISENSALSVMNNMITDEGTALQTVALVDLFEELSERYPRNKILTERLRRTIRWKMQNNAMTIKGGLFPDETATMIQENRWLLEKLFEFHRRHPGLIIVYFEDDPSLFRSIDPEIARDLEELDRLQGSILEYSN